MGLLLYNRYGFLVESPNDDHMMVTSWLNCSIPGDFSENNGYDDFSMESPNDNPLKVLSKLIISQRCYMYPLIVMVVALVIIWDIVLKSHKVFVLLGIILFCWSCYLYQFHLTTHNVLLSTKIEYCICPLKYEYKCSK